MSRSRILDGFLEIRRSAVVGGRLRHAIQPPKRVRLNGGEGEPVDLFAEVERLFVELDRSRPQLVGRGRESRLSSLGHLLDGGIEDLPEERAVVAVAKGVEWYLGDIVQ